MITLGLEKFIRNPPESVRNRRLAILANHASTDRNFQHIVDLVNKAIPGSVKCLFSPQHGFFSEKQDNMIESAHGIDGRSKIPVFSLYSKDRQPTEAMFDLFDVLLIDLVDVGTRVYTFWSTMIYCLEAAKKYGKHVIVLDRPNPVGGEMVEGNVLKEECASFVGLYPIPMRHGMTFGELANLVNDHFQINASLEIVTMTGWKRSMLFRDTGLPWVFPSPNMPTPDTALVYPGQVVLEGTNISEGRGTTLPFELFGAPFIKHNEILERLSETPLPGCIFRPVVFEPTSNKWQGKTCFGFQIHPTDCRLFLPYRTSLALLQAVMTLYPEDFQLKAPPYEYEFDRRPVDLIVGDMQLAERLRNGEDILGLEAGWQDELVAFMEVRDQYLLYTDKQDQRIPCR
ncbi:MAG: DUF1343 domain-containing protein [Proteobacteria bacterium]|nr:DUF1343 domain-containing protein [Pseudomonadota bacterium]MBU1708841.1 DUF1343 domain-containing protein [Pseudomonadota bacterium]